MSFNQIKSNQVVEVFFIMLSEAWLELALACNQILISKSIKNKTHHNHAFNPFVAPDPVEVMYFFLRNWPYWW
jgi:hypothetical protein